VTMTKSPPAPPSPGNGTVRKKLTYTTGQIAKICDVAPRTVSHWIDRGLLKGYRIPGSSDRRVHREQLLKFMIENKMDAAQIDSLRPRMLVIGASELERKQIERIMSSAFEGELTPKFVDTEFAAGMEITADYHIVLICFSEFGRGTSIRLCYSIKSRTSRIPTTVIAVAAEDESDLDSLDMFDEAMKSPLADFELGEVIAPILERVLTPHKVIGD